MAVLTLALLALPAAVLAGGGAVRGATAPAQKKAAPPSEPANELCLACHGDPDAKSETGRPISVDPARFGGSVHGTLGFSCVTCHKDLATATEFPHAPKLAKVACAACHDAPAAAYEKSIHALARRQNPKSDAATCADCHTAHDIRPASDPESRTHALNLPETCGRCHGNDQIIKQDKIRIGNVFALYKDSIHGKAVANSGLLVAANCTSCHGSHDIRLKTDPESKVYRTNIPSTCATCHEGIKTQYDRGAHGAALAKGSTKAPVCADCHTAHQIRRTDAVGWRLDVIRECGTCHADKIESYRDTFHGQVTSLGYVRVATCSDCHGAHAVLAKSDPASPVSTGHRLETCQKCHPNATAGFALYDPHAEKNNPSRSKLLFLTSQFMQWLLIGTFGFFGLHTALWIPRAVADRRRHRQPPAAAKAAAEPAAQADPPPAPPTPPTPPAASDR